MTRSEQLNELAAALCKAQAEFIAIPKDSTNPFFKSKYAGLPKVIEVASPILTKHGLSVSQFPGSDEHGGDTLTTWLLHSSGQFIAESMRLHPVKDDPQGQGSAMTYARRYAYMAALGLVADDDDDANTAVAAQQRRQQAAKRKPDPHAAELLRAAHGLRASQIKEAFVSVGLEARPVDGRVFDGVPAEKAALLCEALASMEREGVAA